ncbi:MAG: hypothetical protein MUF23_03145 [Pirellula sp.]|nr:hypothetical protein [Pirellula sp.]
MDRRAWISQTCSGALGVAVSNAIANISPGSSRSDHRSLIAEENDKVGTDAWLLRKTEIDPATRYRSPAVEGYASHCSIESGETLRFMVSTRERDSVDISIYRMGYYAGLGARLLHSIVSVPTEPQPTPTPGPYRLMQCQWPGVAHWTIPVDAVSGVYLAKLTSKKTEIESFVVFIVRDRRPADLVFQCSDFTWQAYNRWPSQYSLYDDGQREWYWGGESQVSMDRPYGKYCQIFDAPLSTGSGEFLLWEFPFAYWLETNGADVTYISNLDTHRSAETLTRGKGVLSVGHDEYWTIDMFRHMQQAVQAGTSIGFFSGNTACGRVVWDDATRSIRRVGVFGPPNGTIEFQAMSSLIHERPYANELVGAHSTGPVTGGADWVCHQPDHWIFAGTGMKQSDAIPGLVGWEWHGDPAPIEGLEIVATGPTQSAPGKPNGGQYTATVYPGPKNNFVFNASTIWWGDGLSAPPGYVRPSVYTTPQGPDPRVSRITRNILERMIGRGLSGSGSAVQP